MTEESSLKSMGILDFDENYKPPFSPRVRFEKESDEKRLADLNNFGRKKTTRDFEDSPFADRKPLPPEDRDI